jgi:hypothetical protein
LATSPAGLLLLSRGLVWSQDRDVHVHGSHTPTLPWTSAQHHRADPPVHLAYHVGSGRASAWLLMSSDPDSNSASMPNRLVFILTSPQWVVPSSAWGSGPTWGLLGSPLPSTCSPSVEDAQHPLSTQTTSQPPPTCPDSCWGHSQPH